MENLIDFIFAPLKLKQQNHLKLFTLIFGELHQYPPNMAIDIMSPLWMIGLDILGFALWSPNQTPLKHSSFLKK